MKRSRTSLWALAVFVCFAGAALAHTAPAPAPPSVRLSGRPGVGPAQRQVLIVVENTTAAPVSLRAGVTLQRRENGVWSNAPAGGLLLRTECGGTPLPSCVTVAPRTSFVTAPWLGTFGDAQCECTRCADAPAGEYRFVAQTCDARPIEGAPFTLPAATPRR